MMPLYSGDKSRLKSWIEVANNLRGKEDLATYVVNRKRSIYLSAQNF